jgi:RsiW-degrading membrane proteinase PrsW (M82 family)
MDRRSGVRRWAWIPVLAGGLLLYVLVLATLIDTENPNFLPSLILIGSAVVPAAFLAYAAGRTAGWDVSGSVLAATAHLGGVIGTVAAGWLEYDTLRELGMAAMLGVGFIEETAKLIVPVIVLIVTWRRRGGPADGLMVGLASGMGFAVLETMGYAFVALVRSGGDLGAVEQTLLLRGLLSPAGHTAWTGLICAAIWQVAARPSGRSVLALLVTYLAVVVLHAAWDTFASLVGFLIIGGISTIWVVWRMRHTRVFQPRMHSAGLGYPPMAGQQLR